VSHLCFGSSASHQPSGPQISALSTPCGCVHPGSLPFSSYRAMALGERLCSTMCLTHLQHYVSDACVKAMLAWLSDLPPPGKNWLH
jgi:hypothetical protein